MSSKPTLKLDWCSHEAAKYACEKWHYSRCMPCSKTVKIGVWEDSAFIGCIIYSRGANRNIARPYGLIDVECVELTRVALHNHRNPVSRFVAISLRMLVKQSPGVRLVVSYADHEQGHHGGIYQAGGWVYTGKTRPQADVVINGTSVHKRSAAAVAGTITGMDKTANKWKHKYLMPLDDDMRKRIAPLAKPYPKRTRAGSDTTDTPANHAGEGGSTPTPALHPPTEVSV